MTLAPQSAAGGLMMVELDRELRDVLGLLKAGQDLGSTVLDDVIAYWG